MLQSQDMVQSGTALGGQINEQEAETKRKDWKRNPQASEWYHVQGSTLPGRNLERKKKVGEMSQDRVQSGATFGSQITRQK